MILDFETVGWSSSGHDNFSSQSQDAVTSWTLVPLPNFSPIFDSGWAPRRVSMKKLFSNAALFCIIALGFAPFTHAQISNPKIYIAPQNGFESYLAGAFTKKNVPAQMVQTERSEERRVGKEC